MGCYETKDKGKAYRGLMTTTNSGRTCQKWTVKKPHSGTPEPNNENGLGNHNYCRNPDQSEDKPWCFTMDPSVEKETCEVPICPGMKRNFKDEAKDIATKMAPTMECECLAVLHALQAGGSLLQKTNATKTNATTVVKKGTVVHGKCVCAK